MPTNLEFKTFYHSLDALRPKLDDLQAMYRETVNQVDTYFENQTGRLKLRETREADEGWLIYYERPNHHASRYSQYQLCKVDKPAQLKNLLTVALGIKTVVKKQREIWMFNNTRIHLDSVAELGKFIELETVFQGQTEVEAVAEHKHVKTNLTLNKAEPIAVSYSDLVLLQKTSPEE